MVQLTQLRSFLIEMFYKMMVTLDNHLPTSISEYEMAEVANVILDVDSILGLNRLD